MGTNRLLVGSCQSKSVGQALLEVGWQRVFGPREYSGGLTHLCMPHHTKDLGDDAPISTYAALHQRLWWLHRQPMQRCFHMHICLPNNKKIKKQWNTEMCGNLLVVAGGDWWLIRRWRRLWDDQKMPKNSIAFLQLEKEREHKREEILSIVLYSPLHNQRRWWGS